MAKNCVKFWIALDLHVVNKYWQDRSLHALVWQCLRTKNHVKLVFRRGQHRFLDFWKNQTLFRDCFHPKQQVHRQTSECYSSCGSVPPCCIELAIQEESKYLFTVFRYRIASSYTNLEEVSWIRWRLSPFLRFTFTKYLEEENSSSLPTMILSVLGTHYYCK